MEFNVLILSALSIIFFGIFTVILIIDLKRSKREPDKIIVDNTDKLNLLMQDKSLERINDIIEGLIKEAVDRYMILNVNFNTIAYINDASVNELELYAFGTVKSNMTPVMKEFIGLVYDISTEEKLDNFIKLRVKMYVLAIVVKTNQSV